MTQKLIPVLCIVFLISCTSRKETSYTIETSTPIIAVVNYPLYYCAKSIGGDHVKVYLPAIDGDPAYWNPNAKQVINFQKADLILTNGAGYAKWIEKVSLPSSKIVDTSIGFKDQWIASDEELVHSHGPEGEHSHKGVASTTWLNFDFAKLQAKATYEATIKLFPDKIDELDQNYKHLLSQLTELEKKANDVSKKIGDQYLLASHPVYQYFQRGYKLNIISKHLESDEMPNTAMWDDLQKTVREYDVHIMIWEDNPIEEITLKMNELDLGIAVFNICANKPLTGDFIDVMNENLNQLDQLIEAGK